MTIFWCCLIACTRGHCCKISEIYSQVNAHKYFFSNRISQIWIALPSTRTVVDGSCLNVLSGCWIVLI